MALSRDEIVAGLRDVSTATLTTVLLKHGVRNVWLRGARPLDPDRERVVGPAFTLRFIPFREDLASPAAWSAPNSTRAAVEAMPAGCVAVAGALGCAAAGVVGDILAARMSRRGVAALVTDGAVRDVAGLRGTGLPVWCDGIAAPPAVSSLIFAGWNEPVGCGGVAVFPGDTVVADQDGAVVLPAALVPVILDEAAEQERAEAWIMREVAGGRALPGLYPMDEGTHARFLAETAADRRDAS